MSFTSSFKLYISCKNNLILFTYLFLYKKKAGYRAHLPAPEVQNLELVFITYAVVFLYPFFIKVCVITRILSVSIL